MRTSISRRTFMARAVSAGTVLALPVPAFSKVPIHEIWIKSFAFVPNSISVQVGDKIRWINQDIVPHTATADEFGWDTGELSNQQSAEVTVTADMEASYFCVFHPHMKGQIILS